MDTLHKSSLFANIPEYLSLCAEIVDYNVIKEKRFRPPLMIESYKILEKPENLTSKNVHLANILGWCFEFIHTYMNMLDDIMDQREIRGNELCWYKKEGVGLSGFNDSVFVYELAFILLDKYFNNTQSYLPIKQIFHEMNFRFITGELIDWKLKQSRSSDFTDFNANTFTSMGRNKGGFRVVEAPFHAACVLTDNNEEFYRIEDIVQNIGNAVQIDNDILDVFQNGKVKTDVGESIRQGQCTWLAVKLLENGSEELQKIFKENYGRAGQEYEQKVINVYLKMNLFDKYLQYRKENLEYIQARVKQIPQQSMQNALINLFNMLFL
ncbi:hypothetical protein FQA39_LY09085 [Lamprigera yunnana]|nr:hypothetical protein FQA39_LY09085 [Lamprigera yunnana]